MKKSNGGTYDTLVFKVILGLFGALVSKCVWRIAGKTVPGFKNKKSMYEIFHYGINTGVVQERLYMCNFWNF